MRTYDIRPPKPKRPIISQVGEEWLAKLAELQQTQTENPFVANSLKRQSAIDAVERIIVDGCNEKGKPLKDSPWFRDQLRLIADLRLKTVISTGASQVSKTLGNTSVLAYLFFVAKIDVGYFFDSFKNLTNNQPEHIQPILEHWVAKLSEGKEKPLKPKRDKNERFSYDGVNACFFAVSGRSQDSKGGATEASGVASVSISAAFCEEYSSWPATVDIEPRLGASALQAQPQRPLGTPGKGAGSLDRDVKEASHIFCPAVFCEGCNKLTYLDPKGALLKSVKDERTGRDRYFNSRGEILDFWSTDGSKDPKAAYVACTHCGLPVSTKQIAECHLHCRKTGISAEQFLDDLPEDEVYFPKVAIYLSPLLRLPSDPLRIRKLISDGLDPKSPSIYQQNKLGHASETSSDGISIAELEAVMALEPWDFTDLRSLAKNENT